MDWKKAFLKEPKKDSIEVAVLKVSVIVLCSIVSNFLVFKRGGTSTEKEIMYFIN